MQRNDFIYKRKVMQSEQIQWAYLKFMRQWHWTFKEEVLFIHFSIFLFWYGDVKRYVMKFVTYNISGTARNLFSFFFIKPHILNSLFIQQTKWDPFTPDNTMQMFVKSNLAYMWFIPILPLLEIIGQMDQIVSQPFRKTRLVFSDNCANY